MPRLLSSVIISGILLLILFGVTSSVLLANRQTASTAEIVQATIQATFVASPSAETTPVAPTGTIPWYIDLPPTDRAIEEQKEALRQSDIQTVTAMAEQGVTPPPLPTLDFSGPGIFPITDARRPAGAGDIIDDSLNLLFRKEFVVSNVWTAPLEGVQVIVYAGHDRTTPDQGAVFVQWGEPGHFHPTRTNEYYAAPEGIGSIRVIDAVDTVLILSTDGGATVQFDVLSSTYIPSDEILTPTPVVTSGTQEPYPVPETPIPVTVAPVSE